MCPGFRASPLRRILADHSLRNRHNAQFSVAAVGHDKDSPTAQHNPRVAVVSAELLSRHCNVSDPLRCYAMHWTGPRLIPFTRGSNFSAYIARRFRCSTGRRRRPLRGRAGRDSFTADAYDAPGQSVHLSPRDRPVPYWATSRVARVARCLLHLIACWCYAL